MAIGRKALVALLLLPAVAAAVPTGADCGANPAVISTNGPLGTSQIWTPLFEDEPSFFYGSFGGTTYCGAYAGCTPVSPNVSASFWRQGAGDVALGSGNDNGAFDLVAAGGIYWASYPSVGYYGGAYLVSGWQPGTDGCIDGGNCLCVLVTDSSEEEGFFAVLGAQSDATFVTTFEQGGADGSGNFNAPIRMASITPPLILGSTRVGTDIVATITVGPQAGVYAKDGCNCGPTGFRVLQWLGPRGGAEIAERARDSWTLAPLAGGGTQGVTPIGMTVDIGGICGAADMDLYLATELFFDSDFSSPIVSRNSSRIECGTNLADPDDPPRTRPADVKPKRGSGSTRGGRGR